MKLILNGRILCDTATLEESGVHDGADIAVVCCDRMVVTASSDCMAKLWNSDTGTCTQTFAGHVSPLTMALLSADGAFVATASQDSTAMIWSTVTGACTVVLRGHTDAVTAVDISRDGLFAATASKDASARIWDMHEGRCLHKFAAHEHGVHWVSMSRDGLSRCAPTASRLANKVVERVTRIFSFLLRSQS